MAQPHISLAAEKVASLFGLPITNSILMTWFTMAILILFTYFATRKNKLIPSSLQLIAEMAFVKIDDFTGTIELVVFPSVYTRTKHIWVNDRVVLVKGKVSEKEERLTVLVDDAKILTS